MSIISFEDLYLHDALDSDLRVNYSGDYDRDQPYIRRAYDRQRLATTH